MSENVFAGQKVAKSWEYWCGDTQWSRTARRFGELGGKIKWLFGIPRSKATPLSFVCILPDGEELSGQSRLSDLCYAVMCAETMLTDDAELHPTTDCPSSGDWLTVFVSGCKKWIHCSQCDVTWDLSPKGVVI